MEGGGKEFGKRECGREWKEESEGGKGRDGVICIAGVNGRGRRRSGMSRGSEWGGCGSLGGNWRM